MIIIKKWKFIFMEELYFDGGLLQLIDYKIISIFITTITLGLGHLDNL